jgi:hypothetical protein
VSYEIAARSRPGAAWQTRPQPRFASRNAARIFCRTQTRLGRPNCRCADGQNLHSQYQISVLIDGKPKALNIPAELAEKVRQKIEMRRRFDAAAATICGLNLKRFLKEKEDGQV